ncbi:hypothetical protein V2J09_005082 [Rumex salicifolius]
MGSLFQLLPPKQTTFTYPIQLSPSLSPPSAVSAARRTTPVSAASVEARNPDDYHSTLRALNSRSRQPRKSLGQHYMLDSVVNDQLAGVAGVTEGDLVLEIGPGTGSLTNVLLEAGASVLAIEKDPHMAAVVKDRFASTDRLLWKKTSPKVIFAPICSHFWRAKVVANIPFNISKDVVKQLLPMGDIFSEVVLLLQDETALRLAEPSLRSSDYRPMSVFVNFYSDPEYKFKVPRSSFFPQPNVDAAVVTFKLKHPTKYPKVSSIKSFFSMVNVAFNGKRKMLRKTLQHICSSSDIEAALDQIGLSTTSRPEELTLEDFVRLHNSIVEVDV